MNIELGRDRILHDFHALLQFVSFIPARVQFFGVVCQNADVRDRFGTASRFEAKELEQVIVAATGIVGEADEALLLAHFIDFAARDDRARVLTIVEWLQCDGHALYEGTARR